MITSLLQLPAWIRLTPVRSKSVVLLIIGTLLHLSVTSANAQETDGNHRWSVGLQAGVLSGKLATASATNTLVSRFNIENDYYFTAALQVGYAISEYESLHLTFSRGEFSVFTDYEFWPDIIIDNQFYTANLSTRFDLRRFIGALPNRLDPYGTFGLGVMSSRDSVAPLNPQGTSQNEFSDNQSTDLSFLMTTGFGLDYSLNSRISIFFQFNHNFLSRDIIDKNLAGDILRNDFIQTTNNWSTYTSGLRLKFGRSKTRTQPAQEFDSFQIVSTTENEQLNGVDESLTDLRDQMREKSTESDTTTIETVISPELPDSTAEKDTTDDIIDNEDPNDEEISGSEMNGWSNEYDDDIIFVTQPRYGLMGTAIEEIPGSYTLNLHSFSDHDDANEPIQLLNKEGYRVVTQIAIIDEIEYLRVGVGQFETRSDARAAAENLPEPYRSNYFIIQN